ncbi:MAG: HAMP domain-containing histidine kinase [Bacteroidales bacterium]|jgi:signal transduction histidine kinase|nr:HAMP domain-containing histidine kinase [Bacteroidales bacterium]
MIYDTRHIPAMILKTLLLIVFSSLAGEHAYAFPDDTPENAGTKDEKSYTKSVNNDDKIIYLRMEAQKAMEEKKFATAGRLYRELLPYYDSLYKSIFTTESEALRKSYYINKLELASKSRLDNLLYLLLAVCTTLFVLCFFLFYFVKSRNEMIAVSRENLEKAKLSAEDSVQNKNLFLSNMSHEIRTPLNAIAGFSQILTTEDLDEQTRKQSKEVIELSSDLLKKLLKDVVDITTVNVSSMNFRIEKCDAVTLCQGVINMFDRVKHTEARLEFVCNTGILFIYTDISRLQQVIINLLFNASKYTKSGSITLSLDQNEGMARFAVTDTGTGIPINKQQEIFKRFEKLNDNVPGTGLGLSICQYIVEKLGGKISVDPSYTDGARFIFTHPLQERNSI